MIWLGKLLSVVDVMRRSLVDWITGGILINILDEWWESEDKQEYIKRTTTKISIK